LTKNCYFRTLTSSHLSEKALKRQQKSQDNSSPGRHTVKTGKTYSIAISYHVFVKYNFCTLSMNVVVPHQGCNQLFISGGQFS